MAGVIHDEEPLESETDHHHKIDHEHATSHQSFKIHHFHAVPVYVKHEDQQFLKHPVEVGGIKHKLKVSVFLRFYRESVIFFPENQIICHTEIPNLYPGSPSKNRATSFTWFDFRKSHRRKRFNNSWLRTV